jgi:hypothetical protein
MPLDKLMYRHVYSEKVTGLVLLQRTDCYILGKNTFVIERYEVFVIM